MLVVLVVFWIVGKKLEQHFMGSKRSDIVKKVVKYLIFIDTCYYHCTVRTNFVIVGHVIPNNDMSPTLNKGDRVIVNKIKVTFNQLNNGDIITYRRGNEIYTSVNYCQTWSINGVSSGTIIP